MTGKFIRYVLGVGVLVIAYFFAALIGVYVDTFEGFATPVWAPPGIALAALLIYGFRLWPAVSIGSFVAYLVTGGTVLEASGITIGNTLEILAGVYLLEHIVGFDSSMQRLKDVWGLVFFGAITCATIAATIGVGTWSLAGVVPNGSSMRTWFSWFVGDAMSILVITPFILIWNRALRSGLTFKNIREPMFAGLLLTLISVMVFSGTLGPDHPASMFAYMLFPPLIWIALRFGQRGSVSATFFISLVAVTCTTVRYFHKTAEQLTESLLLIQLFIGVTAVTFMTISAIIAERENAEQNRLKLLKKTISLNKQREYFRQLNKARDEFISLASHQLRTPATGIKLHLGMVLQKRMGELNSDQSKSVKTAYQLNESQIGQINDLLEIAQIDTGNLLLKKESADIDKIVIDVIEELSPTINYRGQTIKFVHDNDGHTSKVDKHKMAIVFENLISNASKYSKPGGKIEVGIASNKDGINISVKDDGIGIAKKDLGKLFKKFSRIDNELSVTRGGNGLGLYWVKNIVKLHGGKIHVTSRLGRGSVFTVSLKA
ncbi:MAG TPA: MASE1 domain-containing protein [Candidatus Bathyarchaeia archaeon]|nr:MASE1 domain-containing protein [Candidatus Bathyarchaeia archaeon]